MEHAIILLICLIAFIFVHAMLFASEMAAHEEATEVYRKAAKLKE